MNQAHESLRPYKVALILGGLIAFVITLSATVFYRQSIRLDESQSLWQTSHTPTKILNIIAQDVHVPLYHFILHFWQLFLGNSVETGRLLSLIFFVLSIPALYFLGKLLLSKGIGLFAATLLAVSPFMNWYGSEIRMYSLFTLLTILSQYFFVSIYKKPSGDAWLGYAIVNLFGIFTHYFFFFVLFVQAVFYAFNQSLFPRKSLRNFLIVAFLVIAAFAPWVWYVNYLGTISNEAPALSAPTTVNIFNTLSQFIFGFQNDHLNTILVSLWPLTVVMGFLALQRHKRISPEVIFLVISILIPIIAAFMVSITLRPLFVSRYLILTIPAMYLFIGWIFSTYPEPLGKVLKFALIFVMIAGLAVEIINPSAPVKENYREAVQYLEKNAGPTDVIILSAPFTVYPVEYYYRGSTEIQTLPLWNRYVTGPIPPFSEERLPEEVETLKGSHEKAYVLLSYDQGYEEQVRLFFDNNYERLEVKNFSPGLNLYVYRLRYDDHVLGTR